MNEDNMYGGVDYTKAIETYKQTGEMPLAARMDVTGEIAKFIQSKATLQSE